MHSKQISETAMESIQKALDDLPELREILQMPIFIRKDALICGGYKLGRPIKFGGYATVYEDENNDKTPN